MRFRLRVYHKITGINTTKIDMKNAENFFIEACECDCKIFQLY